MCTKMIAKIIRAFVDLLTLNTFLEYEIGLTFVLEKEVTMVTSSSKDMVAGILQVNS